MSRMSFFGLGPTATFKPSKLSGLVNWYDFSDTNQITAGADGLITQVSDKSGGARHITAAGAARPTKSLITNKENYLTYSEDFSNAAWTLVRALRTANQAANPIDGAVTADKLYEDSSNNTHYIQRAATIAAPPNTVMRATTYAKSIGGNRNIALRFYSSGNGWAGSLTPYAYFDIGEGIVSSTTSGATAQIDRLGGGWYRCIAWCTSGALGYTGTQILFIHITDNINTLSYQGDGASGLYVYGAQICVDTAASEYQSTTSYAIYGADDAGLTPVPGVTDYWNMLIEWGGYLNTYMGTTVALYSDSSLLATYYEGELSRYMLTDYSRSSATYYPMADKCYHSYRNYYLQPNGFALPGYWCFCEGLAERFIRRQEDRNFIVNGTFTSSTSSWTASASTLASVAGGFSGNCLQVTNTGAAPGLGRQTITGWTSTLYSLSFYFKKGTGATGSVRVGTTAGGNELYDSGGLSDAGWTLYTTTFTTPSSATATAQTFYVSCRNDSSTIGETSLFDSISLTTEQARSDINSMLTNSPYMNTAVGGYNTIEGNYPEPTTSVMGHNLSREWSYCVLNYIQLSRCQALTTPQTDRMNFCFEDLFRIADWWVVSRTADYVRPFMVGITAHALINYYEFISKDSRILPTIELLANYILDTCYIPALQTFYYTDREDSSAYWSAGSDDRNPNGAPDLNQLITPMFGWLWKITGEARWRSYGNDLFEGGVPVYTGPSYTSGAYLGSRDASAPLGKQYNQQFDWGRRYLEYANSVPTKNTGKVRTIFNGTANAMSGTNGAATQPTTDVIVCKCWGGTAADRTMIDTTGSTPARFNTTGAIELNAGAALTYTVARETKDILTFVTNGATSTIRKNGRQYAAGNAGANAPGASLYIGSSAAASAFYAGDIYEHCRYNRVLTAEEASRLERWLGAKHGVSVYVPPPAFVPGLYGTVINWYDFTSSANVLNSGSTPAADGEAIMTINDRSATAIHLTQATAGYRPVCETNIVDTWQIARFDGTKGFAWTTAEASTLSKDKAGLTCAFVFNSNSFAVSQNVFQFYGPSAIRMQVYFLLSQLAITACPQDGGTSVTEYWNTDASTGTWYVACIRFNFTGNTMQMWINNVSKGLNAACGWSGGNSSNTNCTAADGQWLFHNYYGSVGFNGDIGEFVLWDGALSDGQVSSMCTALGAKYLLTI